MVRRRNIIMIAVLFVLALVGAATFYFRGSRSATKITAYTDRYTIRGIDISAHNGVPDFKALKSLGIEFVLLKACEGSSFKDSRFRENFVNARKAGLKIGVYHFFRFDSSGFMQSLNLMHSLRGIETDMPLVIDLEEWTNPNDRRTESIIVELEDMIGHLRRNGYRVMLYTNKDGYNRFVKGRFDDIPLWLCSFSEISADIPWVIWQYSHHGMLDGLNGMVDLNVFHGNREQWESWLGEKESRVQ